MDQKKAWMEWVGMGLEDLLDWSQGLSPREAVLEFISIKYAGDVPSRIEQLLLSYVS